MHFWKRILQVLPVLIILSLCPEAGAEEPDVSYEDFQKMGRGRVVSLNKILDNGGFLLVAEKPEKSDEKVYGDSDARIILVSSLGRVKRRFETPIDNIEYITSSENGRHVMIYSRERFSFFRLDTKRRKWKMTANRYTTNPGFALYGGRKSKFYYSGDEVMAVGYYYDRTGQFLGEWLVKIHPEKEGAEVFEKLLPTDKLLNMARIHYPAAEKAKLLDANGKYATILASREKAGCIIGYDFEKKESFLIEYFKEFYGSSLAPEGSAFAYVTKPRGSTFSGILFFYDMEKRKPIKAVPGEYLNPVFNKDGTKVAAAIYRTAANRVFQIRLDVIPVRVKEEKIYSVEIPKTIKLFIWKFTGRHELTIFTGRNIYRKTAR